MNYTPELLKAADHCHHRSFITNKYNGKRIAVDCGQCEYCIRKRAQKASIRVKTAGSAFEYCYFVTLTYSNENVPLFKCDVLHSESETVLNDSGDVVYGYENHEYFPVSDYNKGDLQNLRHIFFSQVQGTIPFDREIKEYVPVKANWFVSVDAMRSFIAKTESASPYGKAGELSRRYGRNLIPFLNYVDVQNYIKRIRKHISNYTNEKISFYAVGEYGPVHFRPHFHILLFTNSEEVTKVIRECHDKSWTLGRSDFQLSNGGSASYVASYINSLYNAPLLYKSCSGFRPRSRASLGFFEKGQDYIESEDPYAQIEAKLDSSINGRIYNFNGVSIKSTAPLSYIRTLCPRFSSVVETDSVAIARIIRAVAGSPQRIARFGIIDYSLDSILSITRAYYKYLTVNHILKDEDKIILHECRCLTRFVNRSSDVNLESYIAKLYRLFLYVSKFLRNWHLPPIGSNLDSYTHRIDFIIRKGIEYEKKADYVRMYDSLRIQQTLSSPAFRYFYLPAEGLEMATIGIGKDGEYADGFIRPIEKYIRVPFDDPRIPSLASCNYFKSAKPDLRSSYDSGFINDLQKCLDFRSQTLCRDMIKHKRLNDANDIFNRLM
uniref:Replication initiator protein n=1 Tax=Dulem virus 238 TaxID=3145715 RepID=A0AAU8BBE0_9VIRU